MATRIFFLESRPFNKSPDANVFVDKIFIWGYFPVPFIDISYKICPSIFDIFALKSIFKIVFYTKYIYKCIEWWMYVYTRVHGVQEKKRSVGCHIMYARCSVKLDEKCYSRFWDLLTSLFIAHFTKALAVQTYIWQRNPPFYSIISFFIVSARYKKLLS